MKAERRHELHRDPLADWLVDTGERLKPYTRAIIGVLVALAVLVGVWWYFSARERQRKLAASDQFVTGMHGDRADLQRAIAENEGSDLGMLARLMLAQQQLDQGTNLLFSDKTAGQDDLHAAVSDFGGVSRLTRDPLMRSWALYGLGKSQESLNRLDEARKAYEELIESYPDSHFADDAKKRLASLDTPVTQEFYDWFAKQSPTPPASSEPGVPGQKPGFDFTPPGIDLGSPTTDGVKLPTATQPESRDATAADVPVIPVPDASPMSEAPMSETPLPDVGATDGNAAQGDAAAPAGGGGASGEAPSADAAPTVDDGKSAPEPSAPSDASGAASDSKNPPGEDAPSNAQ